MTIKTKNLNGSLVITLGIGAIVSVIAALGIGGLHGLNLLSSASANSESSEAKRFNFVEREEWDNLEPDNGTSKLTIKTPDDPNTSDLQTEGVQNKSQYLTSMTITDLGKTVKFEYITGGVKAVGPMNMDGIVIGGTNQSHATSTIFGGENNSVSVSGSVIVASSGISLADAASNMFVSSKNVSLQGPVNTVFMGVENLHGGMNRANLNQTLLVNVEDSSIDGGNVSNSLFVGTGNFYASNSFVAGSGVDAQKNNIFVFSAKDGFTPSQDSAFYADAQVAINPQMASNAQLYVNGGMKIGGSNVAFSSHGDEPLYGGTIALLNGDAEWMPGSAYVGLCGLDAKADRWVPLSALARDDGRCTREQKVAVPEHGVSLKKTSGTEFSLPSVWNGKVGKVGTHGKIGDREKWQWIYGKSNQRGWFLCQDNYIPDNSQPYGKIGVNCIPCGEGYSSKSGDLNCTCDKIGAGGQCFDDEKLTYNWACENNLSVCKNNLGAVVDNSYCADKTNNLICNVLPKVYQCTGSVPTSNVTKSLLSPLGADRQWTEGDGTTACTFKCNDGYRLHNGNCAKLEGVENGMCKAKSSSRSCIVTNEEMFTKMLNQSVSQINQPYGSIWLTSKPYKANSTLCDSNLSNYVWFSYPDRGDRSAGEFYFSHKFPLELNKPLCIYNKSSGNSLDLTEDSLYLLVHSNGQDWNSKRYRYGDNYNVWQQYFTIGRYQSSSPVSSPSLYRKVPVMEGKLNLNSFCKYDYRDKECISESIAVNCTFDTKLEKDCNKITNETSCNQYSACRWSSS